MVKEGKAPSTLRDYLAACPVCQVGFNGVSSGAHWLRFLSGVLRLRSALRSLVSQWDLPLVLANLCDTLLSLYTEWI